MTVFALRTRLAGSHAHVSVFVRPENGNPAKVGDLVFTVEEWRRFDSLLRSIPISLDASVEVHDPTREPL